MYQYQQGTNPLESETLMDPIKVVIHTETNTTSTTEHTITVPQSAPAQTPEKTTREVYFSGYVLNMNSGQLHAWFTKAIKNSPARFKCNAIRRFNKRFNFLRQQETAHYQAQMRALDARKEKAIQDQKRIQKEQYDKENSLTGLPFNFFDEMMRVPIEELVRKAPDLLQKVITAKKAKEIKEAMDLIAEIQSL